MSNQFQPPTNAKRFLAACLFGLLLAGCTPRATLEERIPATVQADGMTWTRSAAQPLALDGLGKNFGQAASYVYSGMGGIVVHVMEMKSDASAFDARQGWRTTPGLAPAQKGNLFFIVSFEQPETAQKFMTAFLDHVKK